MDLNEFSIACKLIKMKLTGYEVPPQLPPSMLAAPAMGGVAMMPQPQMGMMMQQPVMQQGRKRREFSVILYLNTKSDRMNQ